LLSGILRSVHWELATFRDNLSVPSSRVKQSKKRVKQSKHLLLLL